MGHNAGNNLIKARGLGKLGDVNLSRPGHILLARLIKRCKIIPKLGNPLSIDARTV